MVPLEEDLGFEVFRPRLFERFLHTMYYGKVYYWYQGDGSKLTPVHYESAERFIEQSHWFDEYGTERFEGGYYKQYLRVKEPLYGQPIDLLTEFKVEDRESFELDNENLSVPKCKIYLDNLSPWWDIKKE